MNVLQIINLILTSGYQIIVIKDNEDMSPREAVIYLTEQRLQVWAYTTEGNALLIY
jgi:hypothetical protein